MIKFQLTVPASALILRLWHFKSAGMSTVSACDQEIAELSILTEGQQYEI